MTWRDELWGTIAADVFPAILAHPFVRGLTDGSLPKEAFRYYVEQDARYLREFGRGLAELGAKAEDDDAFMMFCDHAKNTLVVERALHAGFLSGWGADLSPVEAGPATVLYTGFLRRAVAERPFAEALAAFLPCYWVYLEVGRALVPQGSPDPLYQRWIDTYAGDEFAKVVAEVLTVADASAGELTPAGRERAKALFRRGGELEWQFWDAAWRQQAWPLGLR